jgi:hypothetical protein
MHEEDKINAFILVSIHLGYFQNGKVGIGLVIRCLNSVTI